MGKVFNRHTFDINDRISIDCRSEDTRYGFRHVADLRVAGHGFVLEAKCCYYNRTWESYEFQSVLYAVAEKAEKQKVLSAEDIALIKDFAKDGKNAPDDGLGAIGAVMALGDLFGGNQKESNDWKERMLKAGLEGRGLIMPEDWGDLSEDEKQRRLDGAAEMLVSNKKGVTQ